MAIVYQCFQFPFYPFLNTTSLALKINTQCSVMAREFVKNHIFIRSVIFYSFKIELFFKKKTKAVNLKPYDNF